MVSFLDSKDILGPAASSNRDAASAVRDELALLIDGATNYAIYMLDPNGHVTIWNRGAERIKGWSADEIVGQDFAIFYPVEQVAIGKPQADLERASTLGRFEEESWRLRKDGSEFLASVTMTALLDPNGELRGFGKVIRDITDQKASEAALEQRESHLRSILETVPDAMIVIADDAKICSFSAAAELLFGFAEADVIGCNVNILMPDPDRGAHDDYMSRYLATGDPKVIGKARLVTGLKRDGTTFPIELAVGETVSGGQRMFTGFVRDLTTRRKTELRLQELQLELIHVSRLSAMGTMAATLAHELNQPLTAITNYLEATRDLLSGPDPDVTLLRSALDDAAGQSLRAGHIIRRLRAFVARGSVERQISSIKQMVEEAAALALVGAHEKGVGSTIELDAVHDLVLVENVQIQQVLINLIHNAVQAMASSSTRMLNISSTLDRQGCVRISVSDTGNGIAADMIPRLFEAFETSKDDGMGLGLSICRTIIEAHGGRIWAETRPAGGTIFHFTLMLVDCSKPEDG